METIEATVAEPNSMQTATTVAAPLQARLQTSLGSLYRLEREMTGAGMSHVFLAEEPALGRKVVLKVVGGLPKTGAERLEEEIRLSASLQQANIIPVLSAGIAAGLPYYTMPLVEDRSVRERLTREGRLSIPEAVGILRDVARALAYAHAHGVVHRDIKPGNVLLSGGSAVLTDFGIARGMHAALECEGRSEKTSLRIGSGTPDYMAPEQVTADVHADHRVDLYAFGCLAFTLFTGSPPFANLPAHQILAAHLTTVPKPLYELRPDVPIHISALIARCLEKDPDKRPQRAEELLEELDREDAARGFRLFSSTWMYIIAVCSAALALKAMIG
jgi:eukaryotic-like serine/threonine-protein kinase